MSASNAKRSAPRASGPRPRDEGAGDEAAEGEPTPDDEADESTPVEEADDDEANDGRAAERGRGKGDGKAQGTTGWRRRIGSWAIQLAIAAAVIWGVTRWQARRLLPTETAAPAFTLPDLDGSTHSLAEARGRTVVLYFFAPWCTVCRYSSHNINALRAARSEQSLAIYAVGLEWEERSELEQFAKEHELSMPVIQGNEELRRAYRIDTFPTVYIIDERGAVTDRVVGYTTELGLRLRSL